MNYSDIIFVLTIGAIILGCLFGGFYLLTKWRSLPISKFNGKSSNVTLIEETTLSEEAKANIDRREEIIEVRQQLNFLVNGIEAMCEESACIDSDTLVGFRLTSLNIQRKLLYIEQSLEKHRPPL